MAKELQFKVSAALKNIIGSDLINDDFIAVFELVKNAFDAYARRVDVIFERLNTDKAKIIIKDDGKGMNYDDLVNKWLFVAYSGKKDGTEDDSYTDFRDKIKVKRAYAGVKGIGRFSCDRLGSTLYLETIKDEKNPKNEVLITDWSKFENDIKEEFINISVLHDTVQKGNYDFQRGTVLEISNLRSNWDREKLLKLKDALARLINPNSIGEDDFFKIFLMVDQEVEGDKRQKEANQKQVTHPIKPLDESQVSYFKIVNGEIQNLIFDALNIKTTYIESRVRSNKIITKLYEAGKIVYSITEKNPFPNFDKIDYSIYFLNLSAKQTFSRRMGIPLVDYGHIFVYKNGLRIFPYGERGEDPFKMDSRKAQGHSRYLGTREVIGYVSINGLNPNLRETSSRGDGLIKTQTYLDLEAWFYETLKKLEKYTIEITDWGNFLSEEDFINFNEAFTKNKGQENEITKDVTENFKKLITNLTNSKEVTDFKVSSEIVSMLNKKAESSAITVLKDISEKIKNNDFNKEDVLSKIKKAEKNIVALKKQKQEAEEEAFKVLIENEKLEKELTQEISKKLFDNSIGNRDKNDLLMLQHQILHTAGNITSSLDELVKMVNSDISKEKLIQEISHINLEVKKILSTSRFVTNAGFNLESKKITEDVVLFINQYIENNLIPSNSFIHSGRFIEIIVEEAKNISKVIEFRPLEITVLIDNLINNSKKAKANKIKISWVKTVTNIKMIFFDNGVGIPSEIIDKIFDFGYTQTNGSGMGLNQVKVILKKMNATIEVNNKIKQGVEFIINF